MAKQKYKNTESTLHESVEKLVSEDIKKEITLGQLKDRIKEAVSNKQIPGLAVTNKVLKQAGKDNKSGVDAIMKKIKDYLSYKDNSNPEFPHQNNSKTDYDSPMYRNSTEQEEYVDQWRGGGLEDLQYQTEPSDEFKERFSQYLDGSIETGNNDGKGSDGQPVANVVPSKLGDRIKKTMKRKHKDLQGAAGDAIPNDWAHHRNPNYMGESNTKKGKLIREQDTAPDITPDQLEELIQKVTGRNSTGSEGERHYLNAKQRETYAKKYGLTLKQLDKLIQILEKGTPTQMMDYSRLLMGIAKEEAEAMETESITEGVKVDIVDMKHLFTYNKKSQ